MSFDRKAVGLRARTVRRLISCDLGAVYVYLVLILAVLFGAMALTLDGGRALTLNSLLQDAADAAAVAGAAELDGGLGARARAILAARSGLQGKLVNYQTFATDGGAREVDISTEADATLFLRRLPPDTDSITSDDLATSDGDARYIRVIIEDRSVDNWLSRPLVGLMRWTTHANAVAGFTQAVCRVPPLFMCNPFESTTFPVADASCQTGPGASFEPSCLANGTQVLLKTVGAGGAYTPGSFGLLDPPLDNQGAMNVAEMVATTRPNGCFGARADFRTGEAMGPIRSALNVRFDMYDAPGFNAKKDDPDFRPALDVIKGHTNSGCNSIPADDAAVAMAFPKDDCFATDSCSGGNRFGTGAWDRDAYWNTNHDGKIKPLGYDAMSRFDVYRWEIENNGIPNNPSPGENGNPTCYGGGALSDPSLDANDVGIDEIDRRVIVLAVVNCVANGPISGDSAGPYPVERFAKLFLTNPAEGTGTDQADIFGEIIGALTPGELNNALHDLVQLYR